jgi:hypothetical protein
MSKSASFPFLGVPTNDRNAAFPGIAEFSFAVAQDPYGYYPSDASRRSATYSKSTLPSQIRCANPRCQQGGLETQ